MNIFILILVLVVGIMLGVYFSKRNNGGLIAEQEKKKKENKKKILEFLRKHEKVTNNDIEKLLGVSDSTATRYLDELEKEGKVRQIGTEGRSVFYTLTRAQKS